MMATSVYFLLLLVCRSVVSPGVENFSLPTNGRQAGVTMALQSITEALDELRAYCIGLGIEGKQSR
jgi:hypothetical protein